MFSKNNLIAICLSIITLPIHASMHQPLREMKVSFYNGSVDLVTVIFCDQNNNLDAVILDPDQTYPMDRNHPRFPTLKESYSGSITFSTGTGKKFYAVLAQFENCVALSEIKPIVREGKWQKDYRRLQRLPIVSAALARISSKGDITMIPEVTAPQDGRPNVDLTIYQKVAGFTDYLSPEQVLGVEPNETRKDLIKDRYLRLMNEWNPDRNEQPCAYKACDLINWAHRKLLNK